jgi:hypothetical protein
MQLNKNKITSFLCAFAPLRLGGIKFVRLCNKTTTKMKINVKSENKNMKNKANSNRQKFTATPCNIGGYNVFSPKTKNGTKPNKANLRQSRRSLGEDGKPISNTAKPSDIPGKGAFPQKLFFAKRTQFERPKSVASNCYRKVYNALLPKGNEPKRTQLNPIKANFPTDRLTILFATAATPPFYHQPKNGIMELDCN